MYIRIRKRIILDFLGYLFERDSAGCIVVNRRIAVGKFIHAMVEYSFKPVSHQQSDTLFVMPRTSRSTAMGKYMFVSAENNEKFNDYIEAYFDLDFDRYWIHGLLLGIPKQDIIYAYIKSRKLCDDLSIEETLKKRMYRKTARQQQTLHKKLMNKANYNDSLIVEGLKNEL